MRYHLTPPADFDAFWDEIDAQPRRYPGRGRARAPAAALTDHSDTYRLRMTSVGPYRIEAFYSVPHGDGLFPALLLAPGYASVVTPPSYDDRMRYAAMSIRYRGTRGADKPYAGKFPGMMTDGIDDPRQWKLTGMLMDAIRAFEVLLAQPEVDTVASSYGRRRHRDRDRRATAAGDRPCGDRHPLLPAGRSLSPHRGVPGGGDQRSPAGFPRAAGCGRSHPLVRRSAEPCVTGDGRHLVSVGDTGAVGGPEWLAPLLQSLGGAVETYAVSHEGQTDYDAVDRWVAQQQGVDPRPRTWQPQDIGPWSASTRGPPCSSCTSNTMSFRTQ